MFILLNYESTDNSISIRSIPTLFITLTNAEEEPEKMKIKEKINPKFLLGHHFMYLGVIKQ